MKKLLSNYVVGEEVEVKILNPKTNKHEWRPAKVVEIKTIHPNRGERHKPYPMIMVEVHRTYVKGSPVYEYKYGVKIFVENELTYYTKINIEGFLYEKEIRPKHN